MAFKPRLTKPEAGNKYYNTRDNGGYSYAIKGKPTDKDCNVLSNCVGYAYGRFNEIGGYGRCKYLQPVNAEKFMQYADGLTIGKTPKIGACMVWQKGATQNGSDGAGHVAIVEQVISDTRVVTSESGYNSKTSFWTKTRDKGSDGRWGAGSGYTFLGFIYNPAPCCNESTTTGTPSTGSEADEKVIWNFFKDKGLNDFAIAGIMGNLYAESSLRSNNIQDSYEKKLNHNDTSYTKAVNEGTYDNFIKDSVGYGLAQWTYSSRKKALLEFAQASEKSIDDLQMQLNFLWKELQNYKSTMKVLKEATSVKEASNAFLHEFEAPADQSESVKNRRTSYGQKYFDKYASKQEEVDIDLSREEQEPLAKAVIRGMQKEGYTACEIYQISLLIKNLSYDNYLNDVAERVIKGEYGTGSTRKKKIEAEGLPYSIVQTRVNNLLK